MYTLPKLSYDYKDLEPYIDEKTMVIHHTKHHQTYIDNLNKALENYSQWQNKDITHLMQNLDKLPADIKTKVRNNGGGHINHTFFWTVMKPNPERKPNGELANAMNTFFNDVSNFQDKFLNTALSRFGSGWVYLLSDNGKLDIYDTPNQDNPWMEGKNAILALDLWEHAYYLKYQNKRADYVKAFFDIIDWYKISENYSKTVK